MLTDRRRRVLDALVNEYIAYAVPVGSHTLCERYGLGVSPATIRSELQGLEENGYVTSPHTSAGRIPTDSGYRAFVDGLLAEDDVVNNVEAADQIDVSTDEIEELVQRTCAALTRFTSCLAVILSPSFSEAELKRISLVSINPRRITVVVVCADGQVIDRTVELQEDVDEQTLHDVERYLNEAVSGFTLNDLLKKGADVLQARPGLEPLGFILDEVVRMLSKDSSERVHHWGMTALLSQPEFKDTRNAIALASLLEDDLTLIGLLGSILGGDRPVVRIGHENGNRAFEDVSIVVRDYTSNGSSGMVAVLGPTRMDYARAIGAVNAVSHMFEETL